MKSDARVRYTRMVIKDAFITLLKQKPPNKISVTQVCELAEINRATFYKHYADCFDLMNTFEDELMEQLQGIMHRAAPQNLEQMFQEIFARIQEKGEIYLTLTSANGDSSFPSRIISLCYDEAIRSGELQSLTASDINQEWIYYFCANGCSGILGHWLETGMTQDTATLARFMSDTLQRLVDASA